MPHHMSDIMGTMHADLKETILADITKGDPFAHLDAAFDQSDKDGGNGKQDALQTPKPTTPVRRRTTSSASRRSDAQS